MANTSFKFPVINTEIVNDKRNITYELFLPQNNLQPFSSSYIKPNQDINRFINDNQNTPGNPGHTIPTKYDMGVSSSSYLRYKLKYYQHTLQNKSSYTDFILGMKEKKKNNKNINPRESGLSSSVDLSYMKRHNESDFNVTIKKKVDRKIRKFLYQQSLSKEKIQENSSILHKIDNSNFNPRIRFKKSTQKFTLDTNNSSLRGLSQSSLLSTNISNVISTTRQVKIDNTLSGNQYLRENKIENRKK